MTDKKRGGSRMGAGRPAVNEGLLNIINIAQTDAELAEK